MGINGDGSLHCAAQRLNGAVCLTVTGEIDLANVDVLQRHLDTAAHDGSVILDFGGLRYLDSSGINALLAAHRDLARSGRRIVMVEPSPAVCRILGVLDMERLIPVFRSVEQALAYLHSNGESEQS